MRTSRFFFLLLVLIHSVLAQRIVLPGMNTNTHQSALSKLKSIAIDHRYKTCRSDLETWIHSLNPTDEKELDGLFKLPKFDSELWKKFINRKKVVFPKNLTSDVEINKVMGSAHFLISHAGFKCQFSIYSALAEDGIKSNIDPKASDIEINVGAGKPPFPVAATLIGSAASGKKDSEIKFDPSKIITLLRDTMGIPSQNQQVRVLEDFQEWEAEAVSANSAPGVPVPPR